MKNNWPEVRLGDHVELTAGFAFKSSRFTENPDDVPLVKGATVQQGYIDWQTAPRWPAAEVDEYKRFELVPGDVVLAMDRPWVEAGLKYGWIKSRDPRSLLVQRVARLRGMHGLRTAFIRYIVGSPQFTDYIRPIVTGVNVPHISGDQIRDFRFQLPPEEVQDQIVSVIDAYDEAIENNTRRIAILEEMARAIYREWFVNFRFPGHEQVEMVESAVGRVPAGWEIASLRELCHLTMGQSPKSEHYNEDGIGLPFHQGVTDFGPRFPTNRIYCTVDNRVAEAGDVLFSVRAPVGRINIAPAKLVLGRGLSAIRSKAGQQEFLFYQLRDLFKEEDSMGGGTIFKSVTKADMLAIRLLAPSASVVEVFETIVRPVSAQIDNLAKRNAILREARDHLLRRLISGEIDVAAMEEELAGAAA